MRKEVDRCKLAVDEAIKGKTVAMVSSGDAGLYGMLQIQCMPVTLICIYGEI